MSISVTISRYRAEFTVHAATVEEVHELAHKYLQRLSADVDQAWTATVEMRPAASRSDGVPVVWEADITAVVP